MGFFTVGKTAAPMSAFVCIAFLSGCGGSGISGSGSGSGGSSSATSIYVVNQSYTGANGNQLASSSILQFATSSSGSVQPTGSIMPPSGGDFLTVTTDSAGNIYAGGANSSGQAAIFVYAAGSTGAAIPTRTLAGTSTGLSGPRDIVVDALGQIYVIGAGNTTVSVFAAGANGNVAPVRSFYDAAMGQFSAIAVNSSGQVYAAAYDDPCEIGLFSSTATGATTPTQSFSVINGAYYGCVRGLAIDSAGTLYVTYASGIATNGIGTGMQVFPAGATTPSRTLAGSGTGLRNPAGVTVDASGNAYVIDSDVGLGDEAPTMNVFPSSANGGVAPSRQFTSTQWGYAGYGTGGFS